MIAFDCDRILTNADSLFAYDVYFSTLFVVFVQVVLRVAATVAAAA